MALKRLYATADDISANVRDLHVERNGQFVLEVEGTVAVENSKEKEQLL